MTPEFWTEVSGRRDPFYRDEKDWEKNQFKGKSKMLFYSYYV